MSTTITGRLNNAATQFQAGESTGFGLRIGVKYYDRETKKNEYTNYECVVFAKARGQIDFYNQNLVEGSIVEVTGKEQKIKQFEGKNGLSLSIEILNASVGFVGTAGAPQLLQPQQQGGFHQPPQQQNGFQQQRPPNGAHFQQPQQPAPQQSPAGQQQQYGEDVKW